MSACSDCTEIPSLLTELSSPAPSWRASAPGGPRHLVAPLETDCNGQPLMTARDLLASQCEACFPLKDDYCNINMRLRLKYRKA